MPLPAQKKVFQRERGNFQGCVGELKLSEIGQIIFNALVLVKRDIQAFVFMQTLKKIAGKGTHMDIVQWKFENNIPCWETEGTTIARGVLDLPTGALLVYIGTILDVAALAAGWELPVNRPPPPARARPEYLSES